VEHDNIMYRGNDNNISRRILTDSGAYQTNSDDGCLMSDIRGSDTRGVTDSAT
jgi:hypothetical protein